MYVTLDELHEFDLVTEDDDVLLERRPTEPTIVAQFGSRDELLSFATTEYLRDKKHMYYSTLLTQDIGLQLRDDMLEFLNHPDLVAIAITNELITTLQEIGSPYHAWLCTRRAEALKLDHVVTCLRTHFPTLLGPPWILKHPAPPPIVQPPPPELTRPARPTVERPHWVGLSASLTEYDPDSERYVKALMAGEAAVREHFFLHFAEKLQRRVPPSLAFMAEDIVIDALSHTLESVERHGLSDPWQLTAYTNRALRSSAARIRREEERYITLGKHLLTPADQSVEALLWKASPPIVEPIVPSEAEALLADALRQLQKVEPQAASVLQLRLQGKTMDEIATFLRVPSRAVYRHSESAKLWLREYLRGKPPTRK